MIDTDRVPSLELLAKDDVLLAVDDGIPLWPGKETLSEDGVASMIDTDRVPSLELLAKDDVLLAVDDGIPLWPGKETLSEDGVASMIDTDRVPSLELLAKDDVLPLPEDGVASMIDTETLPEDDVGSLKNDTPLSLILGLNVIVPSAPMEAISLWLDPSDGVVSPPEAVGSVLVARMDIIELVVEVLDI